MDTWWDEKKPDRDKVKDGRAGDKSNRYTKDMENIWKKAQNIQLWCQLFEALCADVHEDNK